MLSSTAEDGEIKVWRSKFLASSLMVEELARWKAALTQKTTDLQEALKRLLEERRVVRESLLHTHKQVNIANKITFLKQYLMNLN
uniref:(California timema) hypothetical protein n=1 Tax=Timema californicum TaxID=61474 RepID=A0A7R9JFB9_TIMCA|nr:unnamed protein product [Timema californicum]